MVIISNFITSSTQVSRTIVEEGVGRVSEPEIWEVHMCNSVSWIWYGYHTDKFIPVVACPRHAQDYIGGHFRMDPEFWGRGSQFFFLGYDAGRVFYHPVDSLHLCT